MLNLPFKVKNSCISETAARIAKITIFSTPAGLRNHQLGNFDHIRHGGVKFHKKNELWPTFPKMILGHPEVVLQSFRPVGYSVK